MSHHQRDNGDDMRIDIKETMRKDVLAGVAQGRSGLSKLLELAAEPNEPDVLYLDFRSVEVATASYLRECVVNFKKVLRAQGSNLYPVIANANPECLEELEVILVALSDAMIACDCNAKGQVSRTQIIGELEEKQKLTFDLVVERNETDANELMVSASKDESIKRTGWNNRLAALASKGLVLEVPKGKSKRYRAIFAKEFA